MGDLSQDVEQCLCDCACDPAAATRAKCSCEQGRVREAKRVLLTERQRLLDEMHASQRGIDAIDHMLYRIKTERDGAPHPAGAGSSATKGAVD